MNGTKWYKLSKSNESLQVFLEERFTELEDNVGDKISTAIVNLGQIIFSAGITFGLEKKVDPLKNVWDRIPFFSKESFSFIRTVFSCTFIFILMIVVCRLIIFGGSKIRESIFDNKATPKDSYRFQKYFYKQVLNDIVTGISLEKKAYELSESMHTDKITNQDLSLYTIYLLESAFYFKEAVNNMAKYNMFEIYNPKRENYTEFLKSINAENICTIFQICISTLDRIIEALKENGQSIQMADDAKGEFIKIKNSINKQMNWE